MGNAANTNESASEIKEPQVTVFPEIRLSQTEVGFSFREPHKQEVSCGGGTERQSSIPLKNPDGWAGIGGGGD